MEKHEEYFESAKQRLRFTGAAGQQVPNPDPTRNPQTPVKTDPSRQVILKHDWVMVGGKTIKTTQGGKSPVQVLGVSAKILDAQRKEDAAKKNQ